MSNNQLITELIILSSSTKWDQAKLEWDLQNIEVVEVFETCICGHFPIKEVCTIYNKITNRVARVGNCCVKKFIDKSDKIFRAISRIKKDQSKSINSETLDFTLKNKWVDQKSYNFYLSIIGSRKLSERQAKWKKDINNKIIYFLEKKTTKINKK